MGQLNIAFFWHMHQPNYRDPQSGIYSLPWVRLHSLRGYYDMISLLEDYPAIRQTFNLVPSLLAQLEDYARGKAQDAFSNHTEKPAEELSAEEKKFILANFFMCNWETMVKPYPAYWALLLKRGMKMPEYRWDELLHHFTVRDFRDLQVWFNLTWFGHRAREKKQIVQELLTKGRLFSEEDKAALLKAQREVVQEVILLYQSAQSRGQVEITVTPFYHPILPLLIDWRSALRAMPKINLPGTFAHPEDSRAQILKAVAFYEKIFGRKPAGMWPAEGSVSPETIPLAQEAGIRWMATDEGILFRSLPAGADRSRLYRPYRARYGEAEVFMVFRDRNLADLIGFTYAKNTPQASVNDMLAHLRNIQRSSSEDLFVLIALDGENPWEYYLDGGRDFLRGIYDRLSVEPGVQTVKVGEFLEKHPPADTLNNLHTGSWIEQNFRIWIGSPEDNQAWDSLRRTRDYLTKALEDHPPVPPETRKLAWEEIYVAEGSDWFWWYGDDFSSDNDEEFDRLFRMHLAQVYILLGSAVPDYLQNPIVFPHEVRPGMEPQAFITPAIDGQVTHFYEWQDAGYFAAQSLGGSMYRAESFLSGIYYGFDAEHLYLRLDPIFQNQQHLKGLQCHIHILRPTKWQIFFPLLLPAEEPFFLLSRESEDGAHPQERFKSIAGGQIIELSIPFSALQVHPHEKINFFLRVAKGDLELERHPRSGYLSMVVPDRDFEQTLWRV